MVAQEAWNLTFNLKNIQILNQQIFWRWSLTLQVHILNLVLEGLKTKGKQTINTHKKESFFFFKLFFSLSPDISWGYYWVQPLCLLYIIEIEAISIGYTHYSGDFFFWFLLCVSDSLAVGGWDCVRSASFLGHQRDHAAESDSACFELQRSTALSLWRCPTAVCFWARAVIGEIQRGEDSLTCSHQPQISVFWQEEYWFSYPLHCMHPQVNWITPLQKYVSKFYTTSLCKTLYSWALHGTYTAIVLANKFGGLTLTVNTRLTPKFKLQIYFCSAIYRLLWEIIKTLF